MASNLKIKQIRIDGDTQPRVEIDEQLVSDYAEAMSDGETTLPPVDVFHDGKSYWLADGFHRYHAAARIKRTQIKANIRKGTQRDAIMFSLSANASHGKRRTNADKRQAVETMLRDEEWAKWSDNQIAKACAVSHPLVASVRESLEIFQVRNGDSEPETRKYTNRQGKTAEMKTGKIGGKSKAKKDTKPDPPADPPKEHEPAGEPPEREPDPDPDPKPTPSKKGATSPAGKIIGAVGSIARWADEIGDDAAAAAIHEACGVIKKTARRFT